MNRNNLIPIPICRTDASFRPTRRAKCSLLNARSISNKSTAIREFIANNSVDILALTETWLNQDSQNEYIIRNCTPLNYVFKHVARKSRGGGVALIYKKAFAFKQISRMQFKSFEYMDMVSNVSNPVRIIVVYRPPPSTSNGLTCESFLSKFRSFVEQIILDAGHFIITGDFNFHVDDQNNSQAAKFLDIIHSFNLKQHVCEPTHKDGHTLDLIITRYEDNIIDSLYINDPGISDHFSVNVNV